MDKPDLTAVVLTKNEEKNLASCLSRLNFVKEIIVVDDYSNDKTLKVAKSFAAKVYKRKLDSDFSAQRNFGKDKAETKWVLFIDADEQVSEKLKDEILGAVKSINTVGYYMIRRDELFGKKLKYGEFATLGKFGKAKILRLARKGAGKWERIVHENWIIRGKTRTLKSPILHYPHPKIRDFIRDINFYSSLHAKALIKEGKKPKFIKIFVWPLGKFVYNFLFRLGFLDGIQGLIVAIFMSFNSFLAWSKAWIYIKRVD